MNPHANTDSIERNVTANSSPITSALQFKKKEIIDLKKKKIDVNRSFVAGSTKPIFAFCNSSELIRAPDSDREKENASRFKLNTSRAPRTF